MDKYDTARPFIAVFLFLRKDEKIALLLRRNTPWMNNFYGLPGGKVDKEESFAQAARREVLEELGVKVSSENDLKYLMTSHRKADDETDSWVDVYFEVEKWQGEAVNAEPDVHSELAWLDPNDLPENVVPDVRIALEQIAAGKKYFEYNWK